MSTVNGHVRAARVGLPALLLGAAVALHVLLGIGRVPHAVVAKRWDEVADFHRQGPVAWLMGTARLSGADGIEQLLATTGEDAIIPVRGAFKGALEYAPRLLWPRLCCFADRLPAGAVTFHGRPIAELVLVGQGLTVHVEAR